VNGQGRPHRSRLSQALRSTRIGRAWLAIALALLTPSMTHAAGELVQVRVRIEWGGGEERTWHGTISVDGGTLSDPKPLGMEADEPGSMWIDNGQLVVGTPTPRAYDGLDLVVSAPVDAKLRVLLAGATPEESAAGTRREADSVVVIPLAQVLDEYFNVPLDGAGNRILARRTPGDKLRVTPVRDSLVFAPGDTCELDVQPYLIGAATGTKLRLQARLTSARGARTTWNDDRDVTVGNAGAPLPAERLTIPIPSEEGVYDVLLTASRRGLTERIGWRSGIEERRVQLVVVARDRPQPPANSPPFEVLVEIDPASPGWWDRLKSLPLVPGMRRGPLGNGDLAPWQHALGNFVQLGPNGREPDISWEAYPLPVGRPGQPHMLEVEYPSDVPQMLGISIVEPNAAGAVIPIGLDSGVYTAPEATESGAPQILKHRLVFWPRTVAPLVLMTNRQHGLRAVYGKLRLLGPKAPTLSSLPSIGSNLPSISSVPGISSVPRINDLPGMSSVPGLSREPPADAHLPRAFPVTAPPSERLLGANFERPLFVENFSGEQAADAWNANSGRTIDDWTAFYQGSTRMVEYLNYIGYNAAMVSVLADGSAIYPSTLVEPTPRYDDGAFFATAQDPVRKDVLELLLRIFDREQMKLVPAVQFSAPLAELEAIIRRGGSESIGIQLVGRDGRTWLEHHTTRSELAPYYNPLNPRVQEAMLAVLGEIAERYGAHPSLAGLAVRLSADGYGQLPDADWGYDEDTLSRFERETRVDMGPSGADELPRRVELLTGRYRSMWLAWRAKTLAKFYQRAAEELNAARPGAVLYLATGDLFDRPELQQSMRPSLPKTSTPDDLLLRVGIDPTQYRNTPNLVLLRPQRIAPLASLPAQAANLELNQSPEFDAALNNDAAPGALFVHERQEARLSSFDAKSPFKNTHMRLVSQLTPSGESNRRRFARALAQRDCQAMFDGGWLLAMGQEDEAREMLAVYRSLPAGVFTPIDGMTQPVVVRTFTRDDRTWIYAVNDSPWKTSVTLALTAPEGVRLQTLGARRSVAVQGQGVERVCTIELAPYELAGGIFESASVRFASPQVKLPGQVTEGLEARIRDLWSRTAALKSPAPLDVLTNADFEQPPRRDGSVADWQLGAQLGASAAPDPKQAHNAGNALRFSADAAGAELTSARFAKPKSGRLSVAVWLRVGDAGRQPTFRVGVEGEESDGYYRYATVGGATPQQLHSTWGQYIFPVTDLPVDGAAMLRVRFELVGAGTVWVDDVTLLDLDFTDAERLELSKTITLADYKRKSGEVGDCLRLLEGYWPRYLLANVPLSQPLAVRPPPPVPSEGIKAADAEEKPGLMERMRRSLPSWR
jgi:hypothetical protein